MEEDLLIRIAHVLDPTHPASEGLYERAKRAIDPTAARDEGDRRARAARRERFLESVMIGDAIPDHGVYPGLGDRWKQPVTDRMAITVPKLSLQRLTEKIVRGIFYIEEGEAFIEPPYEIEFFALESAGAAIVRSAIDNFGKEYAREPGIVVRRAIADDGKSALFEIEFFQQFKAHASVMVREAFDTEEKGDIKG
jgi:hypothetical protein